MARRSLGASHRRTQDKYVRSKAAHATEERALHSVRENVGGALGPVIATAHTDKVWVFCFGDGS